jgi:hypothetical protein
MTSSPMRKMLVIGLVCFAVCGCIIALMHSAEDQRFVYRELKALTRGPMRENAVVVCQRRTGISKVFISGGTSNRQQLKVISDKANLALRREAGKAEWVEEMEIVDAEWQKALYAAPPPWCGSQIIQQPCQLVWQLKAAKALYYPHRRTLLAGDARWQQVLAPGHTLPCAPDILLRRGSAMELALKPNKGTLPHWRARGLSIEESTWLP